MDKFVLYLMVEDYLFYAVLPDDIRSNPNATVSLVQIGPVGYTQPADFSQRQTAPAYSPREGLWPMTRWMFNKDCT